MTTENMDDRMPKKYFNIQFPLKVINKLIQQMMKRIILLRKIKAHYGILCKG
jgi:hypothetical protein